MNNYAVSSDGIATALQDSASALMEAGNNLEQSVALVAAANRVVQDPNSVGGALRTISLRLRGTSVEVLEEMGEETDGVAESASKMQEKIRALTGVDIVDMNGAYKDTYTILKEIGSVWEDMSDMDKAATLELMAGKNRANTLSAILSNMKDLEGAYESALNAEGSALRENEAYLDSIQGRIDLFNNSLQTMWMNFLNDEVVKKFVDFGTLLIQLADKFGVLKTAAVGFLTYLNLSSNSNFDLASMLGIHKLEESFTKGFSIVGKEGLTGGIVKSFNKLFKKNEQETIEVPISIEPEFEQVDMFSDAYMSNVQLNNKLGELRKAQDELKKLRSTKFKDVQIPDDALEYKNAPKTYLKKVLIPNKEAEIKAIEKDINDITNAAKNVIKNNFVELESGQLKIDFDDIIGADNDSSTNLNDAFANFGINAQDSLSGKKIDFSDFETAARQIDGFNDALGQGQAAFLNYLPELNNTDAALQAYLSSLNGGQASLQGFQEFIQKHNASVKESGVAAKAAAVGHQLLNAALSMGLTMLASLVIDAIVKGLDEIIVTAEEAAEAAADIKQAYADVVEEVNSNFKKLGITSDADSMTALAKEFETLSVGVDRYGNNISLTSDEYERYREICEQIVGINPQIASGYDSATEAIGNNAGVLSQLIELQKEQMRLAAQDYISDENLEILSKDAVNDFKDATQEVGKASENLRGKLNSFFTDIAGNNSKDVMQYVLDKLGYNSADIQRTIEGFWSYDAGTYDVGAFFLAYSDDIKNNIDKFGAEYFNDLSRIFTNADAEFAAAEARVEKAKDGLVDTLLEVPVSSNDYDKLTSEGKNFLVDWIKNSEMFKVNGTIDEEDVQEMRDTILDMMDILVSDAKNIEYKGQKFTAQDILSQIYDLDSSYVSFGAYKEQLKDLLEAFWNSLSDAQKEEYGFDDFEDFQISLGFDFVTDEQAESDMIKGYARAKNISEEEAKAYFESLPAAEVKRLLQVDWDLVDESNVDETIQNSKKSIQDAKTTLSELANTLDGIQSKYDTLQGAIDEFNERGAISGETLKSLIDNNLLQYLTFTENGLIADANAMKMLEQAAINEAYAMLNAAMVQDMENYALGKTEQLSALAQNAIGLAGSAAANAGAQAAQGAQGFLTFASAVAQAGIIDPGNLTAGLQQIYNAYQNIGNAIGHTSAYRPSDAYKSASGGGGGGGSSSNSAKEIDWIEHYYTEIENRIDELNARLENKISNVQALDAKNTIIDQIIDLYDQKQQKLANAVATYDARANYLFSTFSSDIQNKINNGSLDISSITDESLASNIDEYYDYIEAASQARVEAEELKQTIADLAKQKFDNISAAYENEIGLVDAYIDALQDQIDATEARGEQVGASYYEGMIDSAEKRKQSLEEERNALQASLDDAVKLGQVEVNSDTWYEMVNAIYEVDSAIIEAENSMEEWQTAINDLHWENFDKLISKLDGIASELDNIYERLTDNDETFDENGDWTNQGIAALGMLTQKMEQAQFAAQQYAEQIDELNTDYAAGKYSEEEYNKKLVELIEGQWESIEAYEAAKDEIVDLNKARVDAVKDGMQKELDAYKELINAKKEAFEADKEAHKWANSIAEKEKNISDIRRKLAALASDNSTSANAQKKKLQAELLKAQSELDEAYYDKSIEDQQDALDKEYENYEENQQKEIDSLEEWLDDREAVIQDSFDLVKENTQVIYDELLNLSQEYGVQISDEIIAPWQAGKDAIGEYKDAFTNPELNAATSEFMSQLDSMKSKWEETASAAEDAANKQIAEINRITNATIAAQKEIEDILGVTQIGSMNNVGYDDSDSGGGGGGGSAGWGDTEEEEVDNSKGNIFKTFGLKLRQAYENAANKLEASLDDFIVIADDATYQIFGESVPETYQRFLQNLDDSFGISTEGGVLVSDVFSGIFASESIPNEYKTFLDGIVSGLAECDDTEGRTATDFLSYVFASEDVPQEYKDFLTQIIANLDAHVTNGQITADLTSKQVAEKDIPEEFQKFLDGIVEGIESPIDYGTGIINGSSEASIGNIINTIDGIFANAAAATVNAANNNTPGMFTKIGTSIDNLVFTINSWIKGVIDSVSGVFGGSSTHTSSSGRSHGGGGGGFADGTANANGTAYADGNWGALKTETSLVGELGPEILVRNGKWTTVGENGAEFTQVKKGDIVFNHKQTEQLLKHGHVTGRGKAYASGTWKNASNNLDDLGEELTMCIGPNGGLQFLSKGTANTGTIGSLMNLTQLDPTNILNKSRPSIGVSPSVVNNTMEFKIDASVGELIHVDHLDGNNLDEIGKFVDKAWEKKMQTLNNSIKKFTR